jgi:hypothetical protein
LSFGLGCLTVTSHDVHFQGHQDVEDSYQWLITSMTSPDPSRMDEKVGVM